MRLGAEEVFLGIILTLVLALITLWVLLIRTVIVNKVTKENISRLEKNVAIGLAKILNTPSKLKLKNYTWIHSYYSNNEKFLMFASVLIKVLHFLNSSKPKAIRAFALNTGLTTIIGQKLVSIDWYDQVMAIRLSHELSLIQNVDLILPLGKHEHLMVRQEAQIALVHFLGWKSLTLLSKVEHPMTHWQQIRILKKLSERHPNVEHEYLKQALEHYNPRTRELLVRLIGHFKLTTYKDFLIEQLDSTDKKTANCTLKILTSFEANSFDIWVRLCQKNKDQMFDSNLKLLSL